MELTILILLLPFLSFLILGIGGKWMSHRTAGAIGTLILGAVVVLSYVTAFQYFSAPRLEDGTFATLIPYNFTWLPFTETLRFDLGILLDPISVMMLIVISTVSLMVHIYSFGYMKGETGLSTLLRFPVPVYDVYAGTGCCHKHFPDVSFLGTGGCQFLSADRFLLYKACCHCRFQESVHCHPLCRLRLPYRYSDLPDTTVAHSASHRIRYH